MKPERKVCTVDVYIRARGIAGLPKNTPIQSVCGRPAAWIFRGAVQRDDGSVYLKPWSFRCQQHHLPAWESWVRNEIPGIGTRELVRPL